MNRETRPKSRRKLSIRFKRVESLDRWQFSKMPRGLIASLDARRCRSGTNGRIISPAHLGRGSLRPPRGAGSGGVASIPTLEGSTRRVAPVRLAPAEAALSRKHIHPTTLNESVSRSFHGGGTRCSLAAPRAVLHPPTDFRPRPLKYRAPFPDFLTLGGASSRARFPANNMWPV